MNYYNLFYWITRGDSVKHAFDIISNWGLFFTVVGIIFLIVSRIVYTGVHIEHKHNSEEQKKLVVEPLKKLHTFAIWFLTISTLFTIVTWVTWAAVPTKKDSLLILGAGGALQFLTSDSSAKKLPSEAMNFVVTELRSLAAEAKVDIGIAAQKQKILQEAKELTTDALIERMKSDSSLRKMLLE